MKQRVSAEPGRIKLKEIQFHERNKNTSKHRLKLKFPQNQERLNQLCFFIQIIRKIQVMKYNEKQRFLNKRKKSGALERYH